LRGSAPGSKLMTVAGGIKRYPPRLVFQAAQ
jgi:hypothetical protein